jgi:hypothetical protein
MQIQPYHDYFAEFFDDFDNDDYASLTEYARRRCWSDSKLNEVWDMHCAEIQPAKVARRSGNSDDHWDRLYHSLTQLSFDL